MDYARYLERIGLSPDEEFAGPSGLERLQRAHVTTVPFENLSIVGDPFAAESGAGVTLELEALYAKIVDRRRGGFCYELNGLFGWLLEELGYSVDRLAAMVVGEDGDVQPPANHHTNLVSINGAYIVDVGVAIPTIRRPIPLGRAPVRDETGTEWRIVESDRPDTDYLTQFRNEENAEWTDRYYFETTPRDLSYFRASCDFLQSAPESPFTGEPMITIGTASGHRKLTKDTFSDSQHADASGEPVPPEEWSEVLARKFGIELE